MENTLSEKAQLLDALRAGDSARGDPLRNRPSLLAENGQCHPKYRTDPRPDMPGRNPLPAGHSLAHTVKPKAGCAHNFYLSAANPFLVNT